MTDCDRCEADMTLYEGPDGRALCIVCYDRVQEGETND